MILLHTTNSDNRESILEKGLLARLPQEWNYPDIRQPKGVYAMIQHERNPLWVWPGRSLKFEKDIWVIDATDLFSEPDPYFRSECVYMPEDVPVDRLALRETRQGFISNEEIQELDPVPSI